MNRKCPVWFCSLLVFFLSSGTAGAQQTQTIAVPAGTLLTCTLDEPNFSPATASIDDPVLCNLDALKQVGRGLPRGSYLGGRLVGARQPGHFFGKGSMTLIFDRIGIGNSLLPLPAKVIAIRGYQVTREETIQGHGHATRDAIEWMIPIMWPWKLLMVSARGPQPALKGEVRLTLRVMDDLLSAEQSGSSTLSSAPHRYLGSVVGTSLMAKPALAMTTVPTPRPQVPKADFKVPGDVISPYVTLLALKAGMIYAVSDYWLYDDVHLAFAPITGTAQMIDLNELDWEMTTRLNEEHGIHVMIRRGELMHH